MPDFDEMTPTKWAILGGAILAIVVAIGIIYRVSRAPEAAPITNVGDKGKLLQEATGAGTAGSPRAGEPDQDQLLSPKGRMSAGGATE